jgi:hypothetical protein
MVKISIEINDVETKCTLFSSGGVANVARTTTQKRRSNRSLHRRIRIVSVSDINRSSGEAVAVARKAPALTVPNGDQVVSRAYGQIEGSLNMYRTSMCSYR